ncbi:MAG: Arm DNA-binding domain-containing protein [Ferribacterium limneticum]
MAKVAFTAGRVQGFKCPEEKQQAFLWDSTAPGLGLRATPAGKPAFVYQGVYQGKDIRITIGHPSAWSIAAAQAKARELQRLIDEGKDPREQKRQAIAADKAKKAELVANALTVGDAWTTYIEERKAFWGERNHQDHVKLTQEGGQERKRRPGIKTKPGPLAELMPLRLVDLTPERVEQWAAKEAQERPARVRLPVKNSAEAGNAFRRAHSLFYCVKFSVPSSTGLCCSKLPLLRVCHEKLMSPNWYSDVSNVISVFI